MSKYIYYQAAETPKFAEIVNKQKANSNLNNGLDNSRKTPKPKLSKVTGEFDKPYMNIRKNLLEKLNQYEVDMAGRYDEPEVNATIEDYKRQIIDLGKFSSGEAQAYEFLSTSVQNPYDEKGNLLYDIDSLKKVPKMLTPEDVVSASSNASDGQDYFYLFGEQSPMKDEESGDYILDNDGYLIDEDGKRIVAHNSDGSTVDSDVYEFEKRRQYIDSLDPNGFDFGKNEAEYNGVPVSKIPELNFEKSELISAPKPIDYLGGITNSVKVLSGGFNPETGKINEEGELSAREQIKGLIQLKTDGSYSNENSVGAINEIAIMYLDEIQGNSDPTESAILEITGKPDAPGYGGQTFSDYAEDKLYDRWSEGRSYRPAKPVSSFVGGGKSKDYFAGSLASDDFRELSNYTAIVDGGAATPITTLAYSEANLNNPKTLQTLVLKPGVIFPRAVAGFEKLQDKSFRVVTDNVRIQPVDISTNQVATKEQIESGDPNVKFIPYALAKAQSNIPMSSEQYLKTLNEIPKEDRDSFSQLQDLLTKQDKTTEILVPLSQMFTNKELAQFKSIVDMAEKLNKEHDSINSNLSDEELENKKTNMRNKYNY